MVEEYDRSKLDPIEAEIRRERREAAEKRSKAEQRSGHSNSFTPTSFAYTPRSERFPNGEPTKKDPKKPEEQPAEPITKTATSKTAEQLAAEQAALNTWLDQARLDGTVQNRLIRARSEQPGFPNSLSDQDFADRFLAVAREFASLAESIRRSIIPGSGLVHNRQATSKVATRETSHLITLIEALETPQK